MRGFKKLHRPIYYYAAYFSRRTDAFDIKAMAEGKEAVRKVMQEIDDRIKKRTASNKDPELIQHFIISFEMLERGYRFEQIDICRSEARDFIILPDKNTTYSFLCHGLFRESLHCQLLRHVMSECLLLNKMF